jgi:hypothetical protein
MFDNMEKKIQSINSNHKNSINDIKKSIYKVYDEKENINEETRCKRKKNEISKRYNELEKNYKYERNRLNLINSNLRFEIKKLER